VGLAAVPKKEKQAATSIHVPMKVIFRIYNKGYKRVVPPFGRRVITILISESEQRRCAASADNQVLLAPKRVLPR
jgi:hypothetical protein